MLSAGKSTFTVDFVGTLGAERDFLAWWTEQIFGQEHYLPQQYVPWLEEEVTSCLILGMNHLGENFIKGEQETLSKYQLLTILYIYLASINSAFIKIATTVLA